MKILVFFAICCGYHGVAQTRLDAYIEEGLKNNEVIR